MTSGGEVDARDVYRADVYKAGRKAASLTRVDGGVEFRYLHDYLSSQELPVASTLPLTEQPLITPSGAVPPFFANLLPEGRRLTALRRAVKTSADDELSLLITVGRDPVGDVEVLPAGATQSDDAMVPTVSGGWEDLDFRQVLADSHIDPVSLAGVQDKVSGRMLTLPLIHEGRAHLLKLSPAEYPHVVENENFFLQVASRMRHPVVEAQVVHDARGVAGLLVTRFDRVPQGRHLAKLAVEDGAQLMGVYPADKYSVTFEALADRVAARSSSRPLALRAILMQLAFAWLTGNGDLHAKNFSLLQAGGRWAPSPIYDIPSTVPYGDSTMALSVKGRRDGLSRKKLLEASQTLGLPVAAAERAVDEALMATENLGEVIESGPWELDARQTRDLVRVLTYRRKTLMP